MAIKDNTKYCGRCNEWKNLELFSIHSKTPDGRQWHCKACQKAYAKEVFAVKSVRDRNRYHNNKDMYLDAMYKRKYGISLQHYNAILKKQNGKCAICHGACSTGRRLAVDHDHLTGIVRGLLCSPCNQAIGKLKDCPLVIKRAFEYVMNRSHMV